MYSICSTNMRAGGTGVLTSCLLESMMFHVNRLVLTTTTTTTNHSADPWVTWSSDVTSNKTRIRIRFHRLSFCCIVTTETGAHKTARKETVFMIIICGVKRANSKNQECTNVNLYVDLFSYTATFSRVLEMRLEMMVSAEMHHKTPHQLSALYI